MKIALIGYGKMGKTIEHLAIQRKHQIILKISDDIANHDLSEADVAIDFSIPEAAFENITTCFRQQVPVVSGTTGWLEKFEEAVDICRATNSGFIYASNFSLGVNLFFELNKKLADMMAVFEDYDVDLKEIHHTQKKDAPSGTAITLAEQIIERTGKKGWTLNEKKENHIPIRASRIDEVPGTHIVSYESAVDTIRIEHEAHSRDGFALGAVIAAEWLLEKKGVFSMKDVLFGNKNKL